LVALLLVAMPRLVLALVLARLTKMPSCRTRCLRTGTTARWGGALSVVGKVLLLLLPPPLEDKGHHHH
jgi:hypothetical protein